MEDEEIFYVIEKEFWETWAMHTAFTDNKNFSFKKEKKSIIDNAGLVEPLHEHRLKEVTYNEDFIVVPK